METSYTSDEIYQILEKEIIDLDIKPGQNLSEHTLCSRFSVSRTPIRSVLQRLQLNGLVTVTPYKGTVVTLLDFEIINQIIYQRIAVETMVLRDFVNNCDPVDVERIRHNIKTMQALLAEKIFETNSFYEIDSLLHEIWFRSTRKMYLWECFQKAQCHYSRFRMLDIVETKNFIEILHEHQEILALVENKDIDAIEPLMKKHLYGGITRLGHLIFTDFKSYFVSNDTI